MNSRRNSQLVKTIWGYVMGFIYATQQKKIEQQLGAILWKDIQEERINAISGR
jgi:hypothetical protein